MEILKEELIALNRGLFQIVTRTQRCTAVGAALVQFGIAFGAEAKKIEDKYPEHELTFKIKELKKSITDKWPKQEKCLEEIINKVPKFQRWFYDKYPELQIEPGGPFEVDIEAQKKGD